MGQRLANGRSPVLNYGWCGLGQDLGGRAVVALLVRSEVGRCGLDVGTRRSRDTALHRQVHVEALVIGS